MERGRELRVAKTVAAKEEKLCLAPPDHTENTPDSLALFGGGVKLLRRRRGASESQQALVMEAAGLAAQLIQPHPHGRPIEPSFGVFRMRLWIPRKFEEDFDGDFLGTGMVANHSDNHARDARVLGAEQGFEVEIDSARRKVDRKFGRRGL